VVVRVVASSAVKDLEVSWSREGRGRSEGEKESRGGRIINFYGLRRVRSGIEVLEIKMNGQEADMTDRMLRAWAARVQVKRNRRIWL